MGQATDRSSADVVDLLITNALIVDWSGIYKVKLLFLITKNADVLMSKLGRRRSQKWHYPWYW